MITVFILNMAYEKNSLIVIYLTFASIWLGIFFLSIGLNIGGYTVPLFNIVGGFILLIESKIRQKLPFSISKLKELSSLQYIAIGLGGISILHGILTLPAINMPIDFFVQTSGFVALMIGLSFIVEGFTNN